MKRTSIKDVAKAAGVSITTVSRALNGYSDVSLQTKKRIEEIAAQLNYAPDANARSLGGKTETTVALVVSSLKPTNENGHVFGLISGLYHTCTRLGFEFILLATSAAKQQSLSFVQLCRKKNVNGVVFSGLRLDDPYYHEVMECDIPCALIDIKTDNKNKCNISIDNIGAAYTAVNYLIEQGHCKIGMINGEKEADVSRQRYLGYKQALTEANIELQRGFIIYCDFDEEKAYNNTIELLQLHPEITALFCASDLMAIGAIRALKSMNKKIPQDVSVIGFDDMDIAKYVYHGITTIKQDPFIMGAMAGEAVGKLIKKEPMDHQVTIPHEFIIRGTTGKRV